LAVNWNITISITSDHTGLHDHNLDIQRNLESNLTTFFLELIIVGGKNEGFRYNNM